MTGAIIGLAATVAAALLATYGVLRSGRAPAHMADVTGMSMLVDQLQEERDDLRRRLEACEHECERLRGARG